MARESREENNSGNTMLGLIFLLIGIGSALIPTFYIYTKGGSDDFFYVTTTENNITTTEYSPAFVIGMLVFCYLFVAAFIIGGMMMMKIIGKKFGIWISGILGFRESNDEDILPKVFIRIGLLLLIIGGGLLTWDITSRQSMIKTEATVVKTYSSWIRSKGSSKKVKHNFAILKYQIDGKEYMSQVTVSEFFYDSQVIVYCDRNNPIRCRMGNDFLLWYIILFSVGTLFCGGGMFIRHDMKKSKHKLR